MRTYTFTVSGKTYSFEANNFQEARAMLVARLASE